MKETHPPDLKSAITRLGNELHNEGHRLTRQRTLIAETFLMKKDHVRVRNLHKAVRKRSQSVSLSTVYHTMTILEKLGMAKRISGLRNESIFDSNVEPHVNMVCRICGRVEDIHIGMHLFSKLTAAANGNGYRDPAVEITVRGECNLHN